MFRTVILGVFFSLFFYITHQVLHGTDLAWWANALVIAFVASLFGVVLALPLYFWMASRRDHKPWYDTFYFYTYLSLAYINFLIFTVIFRDIFALILIAFQPDYTSDQVYSPTSMLAVLGLPMMFILLGALVVRGGVRHKKVVLTFPQLPPELENFHLLHITDLHIGDSLPIKFVENLIKASNGLSIDAVVFTGDILDGAAERHQTELNLLKTLRHRHGVFYVPGNHEYYWRAEHSIEAFRKLGFEVLINDTRAVQVGAATLEICGIPDPEARTFGYETPDFEKIKSKMLANSFKLLLSHQSWTADIAAPYGFDLQLSGHTHGGQFFPWNYLVGLVQKYAKGLYRIGNMQLYVNQGAGYWGPSVRLGTYCELAEIILTRGPQ